MEYTDYYVARGTPQDVRDRIDEVADAAVLVDEFENFVPFVTESSADEFAAWDWLLRVYDAEGSAWGFVLWNNGKEVARAEWGENGEWGIDAADNGLKGEPDDVASALGIDVDALHNCMNAEGVYVFCDLVGFPHQYCLYPHEMPPGVNLMSDFG